MHVILVSGSLRHGSLNSALVRAATSTVERHGHRAATLGLRDFPPYDGDVEAAGLPAVVRAAKDAVAAADLVVVSTPEYNGAPSGVLKNALDWLSRPYRASVLTGRPAAIASVAPASHGGRLALDLLRDTLTHCGAVVSGHDLALGVDPRWHDGELRPDVAARVDRWLTRLLRTPRTGSSDPDGPSRTTTRKEVTTHVP